LGRNGWGGPVEGRPQSEVSRGGAMNVGWHRRCRNSAVCIEDRVFDGIPGGSA
jgi:hypothetical protein